MIISKEYKVKRTNSKVLRRIARKEVLSNWHPKFFVYKHFMDVNCTYHWVFFDTVARKGVRVDSGLGQEWSWDYKLI